MNSVLSAGHGASAAMPEAIRGARSVWAPAPLQAATFLIRSAAMELAAEPDAATVDGVIGDLNRAIHLLHDHRRNIAQKEAVDYFRALARAVGQRDPRRAQELLATAEEIDQASADRLALECGAVMDGGSL